MLTAQGIFRFNLDEYAFNAYRILGTKRTQHSFPNYIDWLFSIKSVHEWQKKKHLNRYIDEIF